ncbi:hypothetical protein [Paraburkholderia dipogonis]|uniref:hypothetical protein n=1 Tax=Paraburkholderia dipogonis TaxID=1211383 RepID=UPI0038B99BD7
MHAKKLLRWRPSRKTFIELTHTSSVLTNCNLHTIKRLKISFMRPIDFLDIPPEVSTRSLTTVERSFGLDWLAASNGAHKLQRLWQRLDFLATIELITLGDAIALVKEIDSAWIVDRIKDIKVSSATSHGHLFEILGIAMLARAGMRVRPTRGNLPGVDALVSFADGFEVRLSMKNHDISDHERFFRERSRKTRASIQKSLRAKSSSAQVVIETFECLTEPDWAKVENFISAVPAITAQPYTREAIPKKVAVGISKLAQEMGTPPLAATHFSDTFIAISPHHKNEQKNFIDKVYKATTNLRKHATRSERTANVVFMKLHPTATLNDIETYARELLNDAESDPGVDAMLLYQSSFIRRADQSSVTHHLRFITSPRYFPAEHQFNLAALIGLVSTESSHNKLHSSNGAKLLLEGKYVYQTGDHYYLAQVTADGFSAKLTADAPGILAHAVFTQPPPGSVIKGRFPPDEELAIL